MANAMPPNARKLPRKANVDLDRIVDDGSVAWASRLARELVLGNSGQQLLERDASFQAREVRAHAEVRPAAEGLVRYPRSRYIKYVRVCINLRITIGSGE